MKEYIEQRAVKTAEYIIETKATVRQAARKFGVSKSTVHKDITSRLSMFNPSLANEARAVLEVNKKNATFAAVSLHVKNTYIKTADTSYLK